MILIPTYRSPSYGINTHPDSAAHDISKQHKEKPDGPNREISNYLHRVVPVVILVFGIWVIKLPSYHS
jgi:hypothetical protein